MRWEIKRSGAAFSLWCDGVPLLYDLVSVEDAREKAARRGALQVFDRTNDGPDERGTIVFWMLGMGMVVLLVAGLCLDIWRAVGAERALATAVDAAAASGANGLDEAAYRADGTVQLDPARAEDLAAQTLAAQPESALITASSISATTGEVMVRAEATVPMTLTKIFGAGDRTVSAKSDARPQRS